MYNHTGLQGRLTADAPHTGAHANVMCKKVHSITTFGVVPNTKTSYLQVPEGYC